MRDWTWQTWVGKTILLFLAIVALVIDQFMIDLPFWMILAPILTQVAQWFLAWMPGTKWQIVLGKGMILIVAAVQIIIGAFPGVNFDVLLMLVPIISGIAQILISKYGTVEPERLAA